MGNRYHKKLEDKLLITIYQNYVAAHGEQPSSLEGFKFNSLDSSLYGEGLETLETPIDVLNNVDARYIRNLKDKELIAQQSETPWTYSLTEKGFIKARELVSPYKHFFITHWKFIIGTSLAFLSAIIAIMRYIQCP